MYVDKYTKINGVWTSESAIANLTNVTLNSSYAGYTPNITAIDANSFYIYYYGSATASSGTGVYVDKYQYS